ncbi:Hint domain-containing protein [Aquicoccus sp. G2-2]|uniref:Hint domain-containing protein n=1 Tax=Aquicoccus sp. G2-2 TaxID=3092120 RepID=UPI002AE092A7|nr:Hint domain-containing protein [Aquicoccus sp. G2-2]MEA1113466.1 Hint domain-containing protein [Aquicoccus sp. G2-2]
MMKPDFGAVCGNASAYSAPESACGFPAGSIVLTLDGEMPVEHLMPGDRIIARDCGMTLLRDIVAQTHNCAMVRVKGGSLGHTRPGEDVLLPARQRVLLRDWRAQALFGLPQALTSLDALIDGEFICDAGEGDVTLYRLIFDTPHILYVGGLELACSGPETLARAA